MARNSLVINCDLRETRVALIEDGVIAELQIERAGSKSTVGNIVLGKVTRVLPGMQAAFIDVGLERAAFLHVEDLIRPDDFEAYLAREDATADPSFRGEVGRGSPILPEDDEDDDESDEDDDESDDDDDDVDVEAAPSDSDEDEDDDIEAESGGSDEDDDEDDDDDDDDESDEDDDESDDLDEDEDDDIEATAPQSDTDEDDELDAAQTTGGAEMEATTEARPAHPYVHRRRPSATAATTETRDLAADDDNAGDDTDDAGAGDDDERDIEEEEEEEEEIEDPDPLNGGWDDVESPSATPAAAGEASGDASTTGSRRRRRRRRRRSRGSDERNGERSPVPTSSRSTNRRSRSERARADRGTSDKKGGGAKKSNGRGRSVRRNKSNGHRVSRSVPITEVVKEGDEVIVQISKEPIGTKGARVTSHVSLPGRYAVYLPTVEHVGISRRIGSVKERKRLREVIEALRPQSGGLIVRTVAEGLTKKRLKADIGYLIKLWAEVSKKHEGAKAPAVLYTELDLVLKTARDLFTDDIERIVIDDKEQYKRLVRFLEMFLPERVKDVELYSGDEPIFDAYGIEDEIGRALSRKVPLASGGYLIIDQAEALTAIDVNTGRYVGKGSKDLEETALKTNLEAVDEIAYQLRFRNIGGLVILDLIDMDHHQNREKVWRALEQRLAKDKAKTTINRISELGLIEMTRKRTRESLSRMMHEPCFYCDGTGQIQSRNTIAYEILRQIRRERQSLPGYSVMVNAHPAIVDLMTGDEKEAVAEAERRYMRRIEFNARREYHIEQFDLQGK